MRAYQTIRFIEGPDIADIKQQARKTSVGKIPRGETYQYIGTHCRLRPEGPKVVHNDRGVVSSRLKAETRRYLKRVDRARVANFERRAEA
jgi:hypothetical protein